MGKKKKRREEKKTSSYQIELYGLLLVLFAIIGIYPFGKVGFFFECFAAFLVGSWYNVLFVILAVIGIYMMIKRQRPKFLTSNLIGLYILMIAVLIMSHLAYKDYTGFEMIKKTLEDLCSFFNKTITSVPAGGGIIGASLCALSTYLLDPRGTQVVAWFLIIVGTIMFTGLSIFDVMKWLKDEAKNVKEKKVSKKDKIEISILCLVV